MSRERCCTSMRARTTGSGSAGMDTSDLAGDSAGTRFQEARQELEMATSGKHDLSFDFTEPEAYRRDVPDDEFFGSIVRSATGGAEQFARLAVLARRAKALCRVDRYREK